MASAFTFRFPLTSGSCVYISRASHHTRPQVKQAHLRQIDSSLSGRRHESTRRRLVKRLTIPSAPILKTHKVQNRAAQQNLPRASHIIFNPPAAAPNVLHTPLKFLPLGDARRKLYENKALPSMYNFPGQQQILEEESQAGGDALEDFFQGGNVFKDAARALGYGRDPSNVASTLMTSSFSASPVTLPGTALHSIPHTFPYGLAPRLPDSSLLPPAIYTKSRPEPRILTQEDVEEIRELRQTDPEKWTIRALCQKYGCNFGVVRAIQVSHEAHAAHQAQLSARKGKWGRKKGIARMERARRKELWERDA